MGKITDIKNQKFNKLTALEFVGLDGTNKALWLCECECGNRKIVTGKALRTGSTKSCGCQKRESIIKRNTTHGGTNTKLYNTWRAMKSRCNNRNDKAFRYYGGKGVAITPEWHDFNAFKEWATQSGYQEGLTIERINSNSGYSPDNCKWIPRYEQGINKTSTKWVTVNGITKTMSDWARTLGIEVQTIFSNERKGADIEAYIKWKLENKGQKHPAFNL